MNFNQLAHFDFEQARRKVFWRDLISRLRRKDNHLPSLDQIRGCLPLTGQRDLGLQVVPLAKIAGSVQRSRDFDRAFLPRHDHLQNRWTKIDQAYYEQAPLPPVELIKLGEIYFVKDGHHRVSVARRWGQEFIDAYVTEVNTPRPADQLHNVPPQCKATGASSFCEK